MRKTISFLLVMLLLLTGSVFAFGADAVIPSDVKGTKYEAAVADLMNKIGLAGYGDGTFRPERTIDRAEACAMIVKAVGPSAAQLEEAPSVFSDMKGYDWALKYVNYGTSKNIVSGYGNGLFKPASPVTYNEFSTMLVKTLGYTDKDLTGVYPENYVRKAVELGIFKNVDITGKGDTAATRGDVAQMAASVVDAILEKYKKEEVDVPTVPSTTEGSLSTSDNSSFESYGGAFGMINGVSKVVDKDGNKVDQIEFLMNGKTYLLNTNKENLIYGKKIDYDGSVYYLKFGVDSAVKSITNDPAAATAKQFSAIAGTAGWDSVADRSSTVVTLEGGAEFNIMGDAVFYRAVFDGSDIEAYQSGSLSDIRAGAKIRAYDVTDDQSQVADIVVYVTDKDAAKHGI